MTTLRELPVGERAKIIKIHGSPAIKQRLLDMGVTRGAEVYMRKEAPLGDPVEITILGYELSLRKADAAMIEIDWQPSGN